MTSFYSVKCRDYWKFGATYEEHVVKVFCYVKWICGLRNHCLFNATPIYPIFPPTKFIFCWFSQPVQIPLRMVKFLIKFAFPYLRFRIESSKCLGQVSLNKGIFVYETFILITTKLTCTQRHAFLFLSYKGLLVHTDILKPLSWLIWADSST